MKLIKDIGMIFATDNSKMKRHFGIYECPDCFTHIQIDMANVNHRGVSKCLSCSNTSHKGTGTRLYNIWCAMKSRCKSDKKQYKSRGITVCKEWEGSFESFKKWSLNNGYKDSLSIDRINNDGNYNPSNCRWATHFIQTRNTRLIHTTNTSGFRGVSWNKKANKYSAQVQLDRKKKHLGLFKYPYTAALVRDSYIIINNLEHTLNYKRII